MYGLVNRAIEQLVVSLKGEDAWARVRARAGAADDGFIAMRPYEDDLTYRLVGAVSEETGLGAEQVLEAFGEYWILYTAKEGYGELLDMAGQNLRDFLGGLNEMHGRVEMIFPHMKLPMFSVTDLAPGEYEVHYHSERAGLAPMVSGLLKGLAKRVGQAADISHVKASSAADPGDVFLVKEAGV